MRTIPIFRLLLVFAVALSLASLPGPMSSGFHLPTIQPARAVPAPNEAWYPAGPSMSTFLGVIYTDETAEFAGLQATPSQVDITDWPLVPSDRNPTGLCGQPAFFCSQTISETGYFELQFMLANNFWGVNMNFGNNANGTLIRQGIAHLVDKVSFTSNQANLAGVTQPIDNPLPLNNGGLPTPNACNWDANATQTGSNCVVGASSGTGGTFTGGTAYHLAPATGVNFPWQPALGSPDFCAAANHFILAGLASGKGANCVLTGIASSVTAHTVNIFIRIDNNPRFQLGQSIAQEICALFGQGFATGCAPFLTVTPGPITSFPGFITSNNSVNLSWHIYTAGYGSVFPFDSSLFFIYNSRFVSGIPSIQVSGGGTCDNASVGSFSAANYMYNCNPEYDAISSQLETASCVTAPGDPTPGQTVSTFVTCPGAKTPSFIVSTANTASTVSGSVSVPITVTSVFGFAGAVTLTTPGAPAGTTISPSTVTLTAGTPLNGGTTSGTTQATLSLTPSATTVVTVTGTSGSISSSTRVVVSKTSVTLPATTGGSGFAYGISGDPTLHYHNNGVGAVAGTVNAPLLQAPALTPTFAVCNSNLAQSSVAGPTTPCTLGAGNDVDYHYNAAKDMLVNSVEVGCLIDFVKHPGWICQASDPGVAVGPQDVTPIAPNTAGWRYQYYPGSNGASSCKVFDNSTPRVQQGPTAGILGPTVGDGFECFVRADPVVTPPDHGSTAVSAGVLAEDFFGRQATTIPIFIQLDQFGYLSNWQRVVNSAGSGTPNFFSWLSAYSPNPAQAGTIREGFKQNTKSVSPFIESTVWDAYIFGNVYDSLGVSNPANNAQLIYWMIVSSQTKANSELGYAAPAGTTVSYRVTLRSDLFFQDGTKVTSWDVAFSYLSLLATGSFQSGGASPTTGITVLSPTQFDLNLSAAGAFTQLFEFGLSIMPARYWTGVGASTWASAVASCSVSGAACFPAQYTLLPPASPGAIPLVACGLAGCGSFPANDLNVDSTKVTATYDPIANSILIGSGAWQCPGTSCSPTGKQNPGTTYTLTRFCNLSDCNSPGAGLANHYFRSNGNLAEWIWSNDNGDFTHDFVNFTVVAACFGQATLPLGTTSGCGHYQQGIGANGGPTVVGITQIGIVNRFVAVNWVAGNAAFSWTSSPPAGIVALDPLLYEGSATLFPSSMAGHSCTSAYPIGGYDC